jgi:hypothetical protein
MRSLLRVCLFFMIVSDCSCSQGEDAQQGQGIVFCDNLVQAFSMLPGINRTPVGELLVRVALTWLVRKNNVGFFFNSASV